jgi:hypothetical protein
MIQSGRSTVRGPEAGGGRRPKVAYSLEQMRRTHDELELVIICLSCLLQGRPALDAQAKAQFQKTLTLARSETKRLSERIFHETDH